MAIALPIAILGLTMGIAASLYTSKLYPHDKQVYNACANVANNTITVRYYTDEDLHRLNYLRFYDDGTYQNLPVAQKVGAAFNGYYSAPNGGGLQYVNADGNWVETPQKELLLYPSFTQQSGE